MTEKIYQIPERIYNYLKEHPVCTIRDMSIAIRGKPKRTDMFYFRDVLDILVSKGLIEPDGDGWRVIPGVDFDTAYYTEPDYVDGERIIDFLIQTQGSTATCIDSALGYDDKIRGSYPTLIQLYNSGKVDRKRVRENNRVVWKWYVPDGSEDADAE